MDAQVNDLEIAYSLSSACGIRPFVVLAFTAWSMWSGSVHPDPHYAWLGNGFIAAFLSLLAFLEFLADKLPIVDHFFHFIHFATKPIAAAVVAGGTIHFQDASTAHETMAGIAMIAAAANALGIHSLSVILRAFSTSVTFGAANPIVSLGEDCALIGSMIVAFMLPVVGVALAVAATIVSIAICRRSIRTFRRLRLRVIKLRILHPGPPHVFLLRIFLARFTERGRSEIRSALS